MTSKLYLYYNTLRYLKYSQIYWRLWYRLSRPSINPISRVDLRQVSSKWTDVPRRCKSLLDSNTFFFLNESGNLCELGWDNLRREKLWRYNQHYFDDLNAVDAQERFGSHQKLIKRWIDENALGQGTGWEPYPTSLRIVNWVKWALTLNSLETFEFANDFNHSLVNQTRWLTKRLEWHLLGNHIFSNAKALVFSGLYFQGVEANSWLRSGLNIIENELEEQVLNDGGNFERSTMYHAMFLEDLLDLINLVDVYPNQVDHTSIEHWRIVAKKMLGWLNLLSHPDGEIALFNDAAFGIATPIADLEAYAERLKINSDSKRSFDDQENGYIKTQHLKDSGYIRLTSRNAVALLDVAPIGPDYLPGHAHADTLSFELSLFDQRVIVNGGTSRYGLGQDRLRERQTVSHSTVEVNDQSSSEVWDGFRVARRAYPFDLELFSDSTQAIVSCSHDGYKRFPGKPIHRRTWEIREGTIEIRDVIQGHHSQAIARFILHPDIVVSEVAKNAWELRLPHGDLITFLIEKGIPALVCASYAPEFGKTLPTQCLSVRLEHGISSIKMSWG